MSAKSVGAAPRLPAAPTIKLTYFRWPRSIVARFVGRRTVRSATLWALAFGLIVGSKATSYASLYPSAIEKAKLAASFSGNVGLSALFGAPHDLNTVAGYTAWNGLAGPMIIGAIWAFLLATKTLRGEENAGRWELLLVGQTTARRATANALAGLGIGLAVLYLVTGLTFIVVGKVPSVSYGTSAALFFAIAAISGAAVFMAIGALTSQLMATRRGAAGLAAGIFGLSYLLRAVGDTTRLHWLLNVSPLGWIEQLQPLYGAKPLWLIPIAGLTLSSAALAIFLAGRRDLGESIIADRDSAPPHLTLLNSPLGAAIRLTRLSAISWLIVVTFMATFFGFLTKAANQALDSSPSFEHGLGRVVHSSQTSSATAFLGVIFLIIMPVLMSYVASAVGQIREDEAEGYIDNYLVRSVSRVRWLGGRIILVLSVIVLAAVCCSVGAWVGTSSEHLGVSFQTLLGAGLNIIAPAVLMLGVGIAALGIVPRATTAIAYGIIAWSFLVQILGSGINLSHWILDTSVLHHVALAPATNPNWHSAVVLAVLGALLCVVGTMTFNARDLAVE